MDVYVLVILVGRIFVCLDLDDDRMMYESNSVPFVVQKFESRLPPSRDHIRLDRTSVDDFKQLESQQTLFCSSCTYTVQSAQAVIRRR